MTVRRKNHKFSWWNVTTMETIHYYVRIHIDVCRIWSTRTMYAETIRVLCICQWFPFQLASVCGGENRRKSNAQYLHNRLGLCCIWLSRIHHGSLQFPRACPDKFANILLVYTTKCVSVVHSTNGNWIDSWHTDYFLLWTLLLSLSLVCLFLNVVFSYLLKKTVNIYTINLNLHVIIPYLHCHTSFFLRRIENSIFCHAKCFAYLNIPFFRWLGHMLTGMQVEVKRLHGERTWNFHFLFSRSHNEMEGNTATATKNNGGNGHPWLCDYVQLHFFRVQLLLFNYGGKWLDFSLSVRVFPFRRDISPYHFY